MKNQLVYLQESETFLYCFPKIRSFEFLGIHTILWDQYSFRKADPDAILDRWYFCIEESGKQLINMKAQLANVHNQNKLHRRFGQSTAGIH